MIRILGLFLALSGPVAAETARVYSGEHGDFTRLVVEISPDSDWTVGRTTTGYVFAVRSESQPAYDLSDVWQRISRARIGDLQADPETGVLALSLGCDCHVFPFEYRPGAVVLDVKPGPAPAGSAFEAPFGGTSAVPMATAPSDDQPTLAYNWLRDGPTTSASSPESLPLPLPTGEVSLEPLRNTLLEQIARGAADGIVDIGLKLPRTSEAKQGSDVLPWSNIMLGEQAGVLIIDPDAFVPGAVPTGICPDEDLLDIASWGGDGSPLDLLAAARRGLYGELDIVDQKALLKSVKAHLFLGFGAEAAQLADLAQEGEDGDAMELYRSIARTLDGDTDPATPFATMLDCDGPAALWAALARDRLPAGRGVNREAVLRSFLALPPHLRAQLGSSLAEKFLGLDDPDAVLTIRNAMERTPNVDSATVALVDAERELHLGNPDAAQTHAEEAVSLEGNTAEGYIALVEAHFQKRAPLSPDIAEALMSGRGEVGNTDQAEEIDRAIVLALALSGQIDAAFRQENTNEATQTDLWRIVDELAPDDDFLRHAVLPNGTAPPSLIPELSLDISRRLQSLGFAEAALSWIGTVDHTDLPDRRFVAAKALQDLGDARAALALLEGLAGSDAAILRAEALVQLGDLSAAEAVLSATGQSEAAARTGLWNGDWSTPDSATPDIWKAAADLTQPSVLDGPDGLLGKGEEVLEASAASRTAIEALLEGVDQPD